MFLGRNHSETRYGTQTQTKSTKRSLNQSTRHLKFRETLRQLLLTNEDVFGDKMSSDDGIQLIRAHQLTETNELGRRVM